ncbi:betaine/proline/choline family ABC transporter ATP-binding protein [Xinfangfangia sp. CPCC 101601]|uniref:Quaternary amine transport ATP-binding protein n=1 Tax=Pseudogemmobacter lacusdianii TaxID=3069608 RepID=A0ABU0W0W5_9RHOB|nr:betaine/proline/choline family ABC transporter ATP-binding protein [Xinfangfangia sp. CPCC 101601]MDQ2067626.1 betaine/proline/choline family ABC transporter ATP-binding protein [Xinfangfangia sp. CPCC 101601]
MDTSDEPVIAFKGVWKVFGDRAEEALQAATQGLPKSEILRQFGAVVGVSNANLSIHRGEIFCVMGLSGSGKSTLLRHINRLLEPSAGQVIVEGQDILARSDAELREIRATRIGMVFQNFGLLPHRTVRENVSLPLEIQGRSLKTRYELAEAALARVDLTGWGDRLPSSLSGGMQQRVGLARALAADPPILLMDEPFSALDPLIRRQLQDLFLSLARDMGKTTVFVTHDLEEAIRIGTRIAIMKDGEVIQIGTPVEIVMQPADDYVAEFIANISRLNVVQAQGIMEDPQIYQARMGTPLDLSVLRVARPEMTLSELIDLSTASELPLAVQAEGQIVGLIDHKRLLHAVKGRGA